MATAAQIKTNQLNAQSSTGPVTAHGKAVVSRNAIKHGLFSKLVVLPNIEKQEDWDAHFERITQDLYPVGYLESALAERVALLLWRLGRVARYERESAAVSLENVEQMLSRRESVFGHAGDESPLTEAQNRVREAEEAFEFAEQLAAVADTQALDTRHATRCLDEATNTLEIEIYGKEPDVRFPNPPGGGSSLEEIAWTAGYLRLCLQTLADHAKFELANVVESVSHQFRRELNHAAKNSNRCNRIMINTNASASSPAPIPWTRSPATKHTWNAPYTRLCTSFSGSRPHARVVTCRPRSPWTS